MKITRFWRKVICFSAYCMSSLMLYLNGAGLCALVLFPISMLEYWDGLATGEEIWSK